MKMEWKIRRVRIEKKKKKKAYWINAGGKFYSRTPFCSRHPHVSLCPLSISNIFTQHIHFFFSQFSLSHPLSPSYFIFVGYFYQTQIKLSRVLILDRHSISSDINIRPVDCENDNLVKKNDDKLIVFWRFQKWAFWTKWCV